MKKGLSICLIGLLVFSCNPKVVHFISPTAKFKDYESYSLVNVKLNKRNIDPEETQLLGHIESRIKFHMEGQRNYGLSSIDPHLIVRYELVASTRTETTSNRRFYNQGFSTRTRLINESVLLVEMYHDKMLVWQGSYDMTQNRKDERNEKAVAKAVDYIFNTFLYKAGQGEPDPSLTLKKKK